MVPFWIKKKKFDCVAQIFYTKIKIVHKTLKFSSLKKIVRKKKWKILDRYEKCSNYSIIFDIVFVYTHT